MKATYTCAWCGDTGEDELEVINDQNACEICAEDIKEEDK